MKKIVFVGNARDFHAIDWYRTIKKICVDKQVFFATDLIESENHRKIVSESDNLINLYNIDWLLFSSQSTFGNIWRNFIKVLFFPIQVARLKKMVSKNPDAVYHAHTMYYLFICWRAGVKFIGSPQGDEILIRPYRSKLYRYFAVKSLAAADHLIVDSVNLKNGIWKLSGKNAEVIQYGIDVKTILELRDTETERNQITSIRALYPLYRIQSILDARNQCATPPPLTLFYPFWEDGYKEKIIRQLQPSDINLGRMETKIEVYRALAKTKLAISIPESDSSPRSVYESIFSGCCVAVSNNSWIESLPECMRKRICIVDLDDKYWLEKSILYAESVVKTPYIPSDDSLNMFDQERSMKLVAQHFY